MLSILSATLNKEVFLMPKIILTVNVRHEKDGRSFPTSIVWEDGRLFEIDKILDIRRAACLKSGGIGIRNRRNSCRIRGVEDSGDDL